MSEEIKEILNSESSQDVESTETEFDAVQAINELKQNSVSKSEYNRVKAEKDKYLKALIEGSYIDNTVPKDPVDIDGLRNELFSGKEMTNLEYAEKALALRNALIDRDGIDVFVAKGSKLTPSNEDYEAAQRVADAFENCIEIADGDNEIFTRELMRITNDVAPIQSKINSKIKR